MSTDRQHWRALRVELAEVIIGRDEDAEVRVDHTSVSRFHARLACEPDGKVLLEDLVSSNGTWLGAQRVLSAHLHNGAVFRVGDTLFLLATEPAVAKLPDGRPVAYLPVEPLPRRRSARPEDATVAFAKGTAHVTGDQVQRMLRGDAAWTLGALVSDDGARRWPLGSKEHRLGWSTDIPVRGWAFGGWTGRGHGAVIVWRHDHHVLVCTAFFATVAVNGQAVTERRLRHGDRLRVGQSTFRYAAR